MNYKETIDYIQKKYDIDYDQESPIMLKIGRFKDVPRLFRELNFKIGAEIGVYKGEYSRKLLKNIPGLKLYGVDSWKAYKSYKDFKGQKVFDDAYERTKENVKDFDCTLIKGWSNEVVDQFDDESLDFVFIDGNHSYEWCVWDISKWSKKVRPGGIVYGHDYDDYSKHRTRWAYMGVIPAVNGWTQSYKIKPWFVTINNKNRCWLYVKK